MLMGVAMSAVSLLALRSFLRSHRVMLLNPVPGLASMTTTTMPIETI
jgi:hypothetical protein